MLRGVESTYGQNEANNAQAEKASTHLRDGAVVDLHAALASYGSNAIAGHAHPPAHDSEGRREGSPSKDEQQVGQDRAEKGGLHNSDFILRRGQHGAGEHCQPKVTVGAPSLP